MPDQSAGFFARNFVFALAMAPPPLATHAALAARLGQVTPRPFCWRCFHAIPVAGDRVVATGLAMNFRDILLRHGQAESQ
jgi:hypothetical protein